MPGRPTDDGGPKILAVLWTLTGLTTVIVFGRVWIRSLVLRNFGLDDAIIVFSLVRTPLALSTGDIQGINAFRFLHADLLCPLLQPRHGVREARLWETSLYLRNGHQNVGTGIGLQFFRVYRRDRVDQLTQGGSRDFAHPHPQPRRRSESLAMVSRVLLCGIIYCQPRQHVYPMRTYKSTVDDRAPEDGEVSFDRVAR